MALLASAGNAERASSRAAGTDVVRGQTLVDPTGGTPVAKQPNKDTLGGAALMSKRPSLDPWLPVQKQEGGRGQRRTRAASERQATRESAVRAPQTKVIPGRAGSWPRADSQPAKKVRQP
jgi:hypothetical protein